MNKRFKFETKTLKAAGKLYRFIGVTILTVILLFLVLNMVCCVAIKVKHLIFNSDDASEKTIAKNMHLLQPLYPELNREQIKELWKEMETFGRALIYDPYTQFRQKPGRKKYIHVDEHGFRHTKNQAPWPPSRNHDVIFVFGGSTAFGYGVPNDQTIASYLQEAFPSEGNDQKTSVYNFAQGAFFSTQERILFENLISSGRIPNMAIFLDGTNECALEEPLHTKDIRRFLEDEAVHSPFAQLPIMRVIQKVIRLVKGAEIELQDIDPSQTSKFILNRYLENKKLIEAISHAYHIEPVFVWQPVPLYQYDLTYHPFISEQTVREKQFVYQKSVYAIMEDRVQRHAIGENFLWLGSIQKNLKKPLYVDPIHYSPEMSQIIANHIHDFIRKKIDRFNQDIRKETDQVISK